MKKREDFEAWTRRFYGDLACASDTWSDGKGTYTDYAHHMAWHLWQDMKSRLESLEKDAARYRWLKNNGRYNDWRVEQERNGWMTTHSASTLDEAIDTAMQANKGE